MAFTTSDRTLLDSDTDSVSVAENDGEGDVDGELEALAVADAVTDVVSLDDGDTVDDALPVSVPDGDVLSVAVQDGVSLDEAERDNDGVSDAVSEGDVDVVTVDDHDAVSLPEAESVSEPEVEHVGVGVGVSVADSVTESVDVADGDTVMDGDCDCEGGQNCVAFTVAFSSRVLQALAALPLAASVTSTPMPERLSVTFTKSPLWHSNDESHWAVLSGEHANISGDSGVWWFIAKLTPLPSAQPPSRCTCTCTNCWQPAHGHHHTSHIGAR